MKKKTKILSYITGIVAILSTIVTAGNKYLDMLQKIKDLNVKNNGKDIHIEALNVKNNEKTEQIIKRNMVINLQQDEIYGLIEDTEICTTTRKYLTQEIKKSNETINEYEILTDELSTEIIDKDRKDKNKAQNVQKLSPNQLTCEPQQNHYLKKEVIKTAKNGLKKNKFNFLKRKKLFSKSN